MRSFRFAVMAAFATALVAAAEPVEWKVVLLFPR
jgi:hypothetical protein